MKDYLDNYTIEQLEDLLITYKDYELRARGVYEHNDPNFFDHNDLDDDLWYPLDAPSDEGDYKFYENEINKVENAIGFKKRQRIENNNIHATRFLNNVSNTNIDLLNYDKQVEMLYNKLNHANDEEHIGIMGEWGSGKSFLINQLREKLDKEGVPNVVIKATTTRHENTIWYTVLLSVSQYYLANNHDSSVFNEFRMLFKKYKFIVKSLFSKKSWLLLLINITIIFVSLLIMYHYWYKKDILLILTLLPTLPAYKSLYSAAKEIFNLNSSFFEKYTYPDYKKSIGESEQVKLELNIHKELILKNTNKKLVIIIDELDRCSKENLIQFFDSIENFINIKNITFIFSLNPKILQSKNTSLDMVYLDKYFKIPYYLPPVTDFDNFIKHKISEIFDEKEIESITKLIKKISLYRNTTPRLLNKLFNLIIIYKSDFPELSLLEFTLIFIFYYTYSDEVDNVYDPKSSKKHVLFENFIDSDTSILITKNFSMIPQSIRKTFYSETRNLNLYSFLKTTNKIKRILKIN